MDEFKYFNPEQDPRLFYCSETGEAGIESDFVHWLDGVREACGFGFNITSGYRSAKHSAEAKKEKPGTHNQGIAADIACTDAARRYEIVKQAIAHGAGGIGIAKSFVHVDTRPGDRCVIWTY